MNNILSFLMPSMAGNGQQTRIDPVTGQPISPISNTSNILRLLLANNGSSESTGGLDMARFWLLTIGDPARTGMISSSGRNGRFNTFTSFLLLNNRNLGGGASKNLLPLLLLRDYGKQHPNIDPITRRPLSSSPSTIRSSFYLPLFLLMESEDTPSNNKLLKAFLLIYIQLKKDNTIQLLG
uniref:uncharacterized protein LOC113474854 n=1 Tax=Ciona intestinalis TaxID=7719 RepID=UPI000EF54101|nr:uncharacterized protein LOC113474854 [Ciona intestinalis]|eukprot:XP_026693411.1 uncharacterized protein LOC113474854 [Ciona intestinalis]